MSSKYGLLIFLAIVIIFVLAVKNYEIWTSPVEAIPEKVATKRTAKSETPSSPGNRRKAASVQTSIAVAQKNIFNPERKDFPVPAPSALSDVKKPPVRPQIVLQGVAIVGNDQYASIVNSGRSLRKEGRETMTVKVGDSLGEYKVAKILPDRITLEGTEDSFEILLHDPKVDKKRSYGKTENKPASVTGRLPGPAVPSDIPRPQTLKPLPALPSPAQDAPSPGPSPYLRRGRTYTPRSTTTTPESTVPGELGTSEEAISPPLRP